MVEKIYFYLSVNRVLKAPTKNRRVNAEAYRATKDGSRPSMPRTIHGQEESVPKMKLGLSAKVRSQTLFNSIQDALKNKKPLLGSYYKSIACRLLV
jgi:hypothetical protein